MLRFLVWWIQQLPQHVPNDLREGTGSVPKSGPLRQTRNLSPIDSPTFSFDSTYTFFFFYLSIFIQDNSTQHSQRLELKLRPDAFLHDRLQA